MKCSLRSDHTEYDRADYGTLLNPKNTKELFKALKWAGQMVAFVYSKDYSDCSEMNGLIMEGNKWTQRETSEKY